MSGFALGTSPALSTNFNHEWDGVVRCWLLAGNTLGCTSIFHLIESKIKIMIKSKI